jgi:hypothetical protein
MEARSYGINLNHLTAGEYLSFPDFFKEYTEAVLFMLKIKDDFLYEKYLIEKYRNEPEVESHISVGRPAMDAIRDTFPDRFISAGSRKKQSGKEFSPAWFDLWNEDYIITPEHSLFDLFFVYKLRQTDLLELYNLLNDFLGKEADNKRDFIRFLKLTLRKHSKKLMQPEQTETINEWIAEQEKESELSGTEETKIKGRIKRGRDDKVTLLNQEQTALLIYCLQKTNVILRDEFLNNKEAGLAFSILTGYSTDTIRQNLNKSELARTATSKNIDVVEKALKEVLRFIEQEIKPEE